MIIQNEKLPEWEKGIREDKNREKHKSTLPYCPKSLLVFATNEMSGGFFIPFIKVAFGIVSCVYFSFKI